MPNLVMADFLRNSPKLPSARILLCHGAGAAMDSEFMTKVAALLCEQGFDVVRFEFPYMAERRATGKRRPPNPMPQIVAFLETQVQVWSSIDQLPLFVAGKSMGGRAAAMLQLPEVTAAIALGYPLHPVGKPDKLRVEPLHTRSCPLLIVQGDRDALGSRAEFEALGEYQGVQVQWLLDGDHDLKPRVKSGFRHAEHLQLAAHLVATFIANATLEANI